MVPQQVQKPVQKQEPKPAQLPPKRDAAKVQIVDADEASDVVDWKTMTAKIQGQQQVSVVRSMWNRAQ